MILMHYDVCCGVNYAVFLKSYNNKEVYILKKRKNIYIYISDSLEGEHRGL